MKAYDSTATPVASSQEAIRRILSKYGADGVQFSEEWKQKRIMVRFLYSVGPIQYSVIFKVPLQEVSTDTSTGRQRKGTQMEKL